MDWSACVICGRTDGGLKCPARDKASDTAVNFYNDFLRNVQGFREINAMPVDFDHGPAETVEEFLNNCAKWHKTCHLKFATSKLERSKERCKNKRKDGCDCYISWNIPQA